MYDPLALLARQYQHDLLAEAAQERLVRQALAARAPRHRPGLLKGALAQLGHMLIMVGDWLVQRFAEMEPRRTVAMP